MHIPITEVTDTSASALIGGVSLSVRCVNVSPGSTKTMTWQRSLHAVGGKGRSYPRMHTASMHPVRMLGLYLQGLIMARSISQRQGTLLSTLFVDHADEIVTLSRQINGYIGIVFTEADDSVPFDFVGNWESAQNYALHGGHRVVVYRDAVGMTASEVQRLCDDERARYLDCYGVTS